MIWLQIYWLCICVITTLIMRRSSKGLIRVDELNDEVSALLVDLKQKLETYRGVTPCYECRFYLEDEPFCPKSGMKMKDGLIFCCYGESKEDSDEG